MLLLGLAGIMLTFIAGCTPELAETPYGQTEKRWEDFIRENYPEWKVPQTIPPTNDEDGSLDVADDLPEFVPDAGAVGDLSLIPPVDPELAPSPGEFQTYTVQKGDTLWKVAKQFYGSGKQWRQIYGANQNVISNPDRITPGLELQIPAQ